MLEARVKQLQNQAHSDFSYNKSLNARLVPFLKKEVTEKEDDDDEEDQQAWPSGSNDDNGPVSPIRYPRVTRWFKCPICLSHLYQYKNSLFGHIENFIMEESSTHEVVEHHCQLNRLHEATMSDL
jgi:hypothetical protein